MTSERRSQIIRLLEVLNDGLPEPVRREHSTAGFVNEARARTCPDCLANGRVMFGCETCGGAGTVAPHRVDRIAGPDQLPDDGTVRDPYAVSDAVTPYGVRDSVKLGHVPARDAAIDRVSQQLREPYKTLDDELAEANRTPYPWERARDALRKRYSIMPLLAALEVLRDREPGLCAVLFSVYVHKTFTELSAGLEQAVETGLEFIDERLPAELRAPGDADHPALARVKSRWAA